jgi:uncharacterized repeat protein (TIGR03803 family)
MVRVRRWWWVYGVFLSCAVTPVIANAQTFTTLASFNGVDGATPVGALIQGSDGNFYGTTYKGGANCYRSGGCGTVFKITTGGRLTRLHSFCTLAQCADGKEPYASLVQASNGKFYGTTMSGGVLGPDGCGTVFEITATGILTTLHSFDGNDGCSPEGGLVQAANGDFYGTTASDGVNNGGTVFKMTPAGTLTILHNFCSMLNCADGRSPEASLVQATNGNFFGTTLYGGTNDNDELCPIGCGTVFEITPAGKLETLYSFCSLANCADGATPEASLVQATNGDFYGTTFQGGANCATGSGCGTIFEITGAGQLSTLYRFCSLANCADGTDPVGPLVQATDGDLYGTTPNGGAANNAGTVFEITLAGALTTLYTFCTAPGCTDGEFPSGGLLQATNGVFYGTTGEGGASSDGIVFSLDTGLAPFVSFIRNPAKVGQQFGILGYGLTGTSGVVFNGTSASFTAKSDTLLIATVPSGATTGYVAVIAPSGTLTSNVPFRVIP